LHTRTSNTFVLEFLLVTLGPGSLGAWAGSKSEGARIRGHPPSGANFATLPPRAPFGPRQAPDRKLPGFVGNLRQTPTSANSLPRLPSGLGRRPIGSRPDSWATFVRRQSAKGGLRHLSAKVPPLHLPSRAQYVMCRLPGINDACCRVTTPRCTLPRGVRNMLYAHSRGLMTRAGT